MQSLLYQVGAADPLTFVVVPLALLVVALDRQLPAGAARDAGVADHRAADAIASAHASYQLSADLMRAR